MSFYEPEIELVPALCDPSKISLDVGANHGVYSERMASHSTLVHAYEPIPHLYEELKAKFALQKVIVHNIALSNTYGQATINTPIYQDSPAETPKPIYALSSIQNDFEQARRQYPTRFVGIQQVTVPTARIDDQHLGELGFAKIDVEGLEYEVLQGGVTRIANDVPNLLIEIEERHRQGSLELVRNFLQQFGYEGYFLRDNKLVHLTEFDVQKMQRDPLNAVDNRAVPIPGYVNNFIYIHPKRKDVLECITEILRKS